MQLYLVPNQQVAILVFTAVMGMSGMGVYAASLELLVEATYPVEETIGATFTYLSCHVQSVIIVFLIPALSTPTTIMEGEQCSVDGSQIAPRDYTCEYSKLFIGLGAQCSSQLCTGIFFSLLSKNGVQSVMIIAWVISAPLSSSLILCKQRHHGQTSTRALMIIFKG